ncbi:MULTISPECIES: hypothetical protein [Nostoc]|uniref:Uncharacterized protein n=1 Tax=Nostoc paludosum FACHB-159 TaxID=2692908 RepID=A0ABR8K9Z4_9NOSO|nr:MULTISPECIES: hypothetical protein [Nostoc]MBD2676641.1 hypothetical protein [Nostoc sp. FACHB-857]MBD2735120.1 hypothetical protein [Nostoc paludosum FACHB-159]
MRSGKKTSDVYGKSGICSARTSGQTFQIIQSVSRPTIHRGLLELETQIPQYESRIRTPSEGRKRIAWIQEKLGWTKPTTPDETAMTQIQLLVAIAAEMAELE